MESTFSPLSHPESPCDHKKIKKKNSKINTGSDKL